MQSLNIFSDCLVPKTGTITMWSRKWEYVRVPVQCSVKHIKLSLWPNQLLLFKHLTFSLIYRFPDVFSCFRWQGELT